MTTSITASPATADLACGDLTATFVPAAGMVGTSLRHAGDELLDPQDGLEAYRSTGAVMGLPFLHPWANRLASDDVLVAGRRVHAGRRVPRDDGGLPIHGVLPRAWDVLDATPRSIVAELRFADPAFPFPHRVRQRVTLSERALRIETTLSGGLVPIAFGYHPYLRVPGAPRREWLVTLPARSRLVADERMLPTGRTVREPAGTFALGTRVFDDGYGGLPAAPVFAVAGGGRTIAVAFLRGYTHAQVYAPLANDVICFEPMTAPVNALGTGSDLRLLRPGATFTAAFEIRVGA
jgi:galactose mutarotase-like enzyme